jgi:hypothetical protein
MDAVIATTSRQLLRHTLATLAYRGGKVLRGAEASFATFRLAGGTRTPGAILAHIGDLLDWGLALAQGTPAWHDSSPSWDTDVQRFFDGLARLDACLASDTPLACSAERLFQGPIADALTHVGQLAMLRRLAGSPVRGENYLKADITAGRVGPDQAVPTREFD